jgi:hypothetical protein
MEVIDFWFDKMIAQSDFFENIWWDFLFCKNTIFWGNDKYDKYQLFFWGGGEFKKPFNLILQITIF